MNEKVIKLLKMRNFNVSEILLFNYKKMSIEDREFILLIYFLNNGEEAFNPPKISKDLNIKVSEVLEMVNSLINKGIIKIEVIKSSIHEEYINVESLYNKLYNVLVNEKVEEVKENIYDIFEQEFGRPLSPIEYELINAWQDSNISTELIKLALKEAIYNGAFNLRYIDKILFEWGKKGIKSKEDVENSRKKFKENKKEIFEYDWLSSEE